MLAMDGRRGPSSPAGRAFGGDFQRKVGGIGGGGGGEDGGEAASMVVDSTSTEWTDEKHSLYLSSLEESFVSQLYSKGFCSNNSSSRASITRKYPSSHVENLCSDQFKVLHGGCSREIRFERWLAQAVDESETQILLKNPSFMHFCSASSNRMVEPLPSQHPRIDGTTCLTSGMESQSQGMANNGEKTSLNHQIPCYPHMHHQYSVGCYAEVSDQNFIDDLEGVKPSKVCKKKRTRKAFSNARVQEVSCGNTMTASNVDGRIFSKKDKGAELSSTKAAKFG